MAEVEVEVELGVNSPSTPPTSTSTHEQATRGVDEGKPATTTTRTPLPMDKAMITFQRVVAEKEALESEVRQLRANLANLRAMHQPESCTCENCDAEGLCCPQCMGHWPCQTSQALALAAPVVLPPAGEQA